MEQARTEKEIKLALERETQARIFPKVSPDSIEQILKRLRALFLFAGFKIVGERRITNIDEYYDTPSRHLENCNSLLRVRRNTNEYELTVKKPLERHTGTFTRQESERRILLDEYERLKRSNFHSIIEEHFKELVNENIVHIVTVHNQRTELRIAREDEEYKLVVDRLQFANPRTGTRSDDRLEIELESVGAVAEQEIDGIKIYLCDICPEFTLSDKTKYEAAVDYIDGKLDSIHHVQPDKVGEAVEPRDELQHAQSERDHYASWVRRLISLIIAIVGIGAILLQPWLLPWEWLVNHPSKLGLYGCTTLIVLALAWAIPHREERNIALWVVGLGALLVLLQIIGR
jgi:uncharacterized protein YjbK